MRRPLPYAFARTHQLLLEDDGHTLTLWHSDAPDLSAWSEVTRRHAVQSFEYTDKATLAKRISEAYAQADSNAAAVVSEVESDADLTRMMQELPAVEDLLEAADDAPIIRMLNALLTQAARDGASDIHIEPYERHSSVRFRVDGTLREVVQPNRALHAALISRLKIMAELDIAEKRLPQDGRISLRLGQRAIDVRVSTLPSAHGERAVLRLLDKTESKLTLQAVGMEGETLRRFEALVHQPHGIILVTGPTGSGKTTTLYAALQGLDATRNNIMTVEDPIEYESIRDVITSSTSLIGRTPIPTVSGTSMYPSTNSNGVVTSCVKYRFEADVSPGRVNPGSAASAKFAARPIPVSNIPPHHTGIPRDTQRS